MQTSERDRRDELIANMDEKIERRPMEEPRSSEVSELTDVAEKLMRKYGRSGSGRASALRLISVYLLYKQGGHAVLRKFGFSRGSIALYMEKLHDAGILTGK